MANRNNELLSMIDNFDKKDSDKLNLHQLSDLVMVLEYHKIEDENVSDLMMNLTDKLKSIDTRSKDSVKSYMKIYMKLKQDLQKTHSIVEKGTFIKMSLGLGMTFGISFGIVFMSSTSQAIVVGMMFGMAIGAFVGQFKEKQLSKEGKLY